MTESFLSFQISEKKKGFWVDDSDLENTIYFINKSLIYYMNSKTIEWLLPLSNHLQRCSMGYYPACIHLNLDIYLLSNEKKMLFIDLIKKTKNDIKTFGKYIDKEVLNIIEATKLKEMKSNYTLKMLTSIYINILEKIEKIVEITPDGASMFKE